jgi:hypothetical protein
LCASFVYVDSFCYFAVINYFSSWNMDLLFLRKSCTNWNTFLAEFCTSYNLYKIVTCTQHIYLSIMDFLRGQYVIYGPVRIILTSDDLLGLYWPRAKSEVNIILTGPYIAYWQSKKSLIFILHMFFQYYYLNIKILKFYENWNFWNFWNLKKCWILFENFEILWNFLKILKF